MNIVPTFYKRHVRIHWFWIRMSGGQASAAFIVDDFGNLVQIKPGMPTAILRD